MSWKFNTGKKVIIRSPVSLSLPTPGWTIGGWIRIADNTTSYYLLTANLTTDVPYFYLRRETDGTLWGRYNDDGGAHVARIFSVSAPASTWVFVSLRRKSGAFTATAGDTSETLGTGLTFYDGHFSQMQFGDYAGTSRLNGYLAHWAKWNRHLSNAEIAALARGLPPSAVPTPAWYFPMDSLLDAQGQVTAVPSGISFAALEPPVIRALDDAGALPRKLAATMPTVFFPPWGRPRRRTGSRSSRGFPSPTPRPPDSGPLHIPSPPRAVFPAKPRLLDRGKQCYTMDVRGRHRVFDAAEYRFYRGSSAPPAEGDTPFATSSALPATPGETFADGTWYLSVSYSNGVLDSGFLPIGTNGETYVKLVVAGGAANPNPPPSPTVARLEPTTDGARLFVTGFPGNEALEWALAYTTDGSMPPADAPDVTAAATEGVAILTRLWDSLADGTTLKVRVQFRRNDGTVESPVWVYSESILLATTVDTSGPTAALVAESWTGGFQ